MDDISIKVRKASKFVDNLIKVTTFLSFILFVTSFYIYHYKADIIYKNQIALCDAVWTQGQTTQNPLENPIHESFLKYKNECFNNAGRTSEMWAKTAFIALDITVLLPLIYFGGKKAFKDSSEKIMKVKSME